MSVAPIATEGHVDAQGQVSHLVHVGVKGPCCSQGHTDLSGLLTLMPW